MICLFRTTRSKRVLTSLTALSTVLVVLSAGIAFAQSQPKEAPGRGRGPIDYKGFVRVIDGSTAEIYPNGNQTGIGVIGITTAPGNTQCGQKAAQLHQQLSKGGLYLAEDPDIVFDSRNRRMYYAFTRDNRKIAQEMVKAGVAHSSHEGKDKDELDKDDGDAESKKVGCLHGGADASLPEQSLATGASSSLIAVQASTDESSPQASSIFASPASTPAGGFSQQVVASGFTNPTGFVFLPDGRMLVAEKHGIIKIVKNGAVLSTPFLDLSSKVNDYWDHGLIGMAADPNFSTNGFVYALYVYENNAGDYSGLKTSRLSRFTAAGDTAALSTEQIILGTSVGSGCGSFPAGADCIPSDNPSHTMGQIKFDSTGNMFLTTGDAASFNVVDDLALRAQDITSLAGKVLHITPLGAGISSNPFWNGNSSAIQSKVWATGVRNSFRFTLRSGTYPYAGDVGWDTWEEINAATRGANLGWPCYEGTAQQPGYAPKSTCQALYAKGASAVKSGVITWSHFYAGQHVSSAAVGGTFYTGSAYPAKYQGAYFYGDYGQGWIRYLTVDLSDNLISGPFDFVFGGDGPVQVEQGPDGNLYYTAINTGQIRKIVFTGADTVAPQTGTLNPASNATGVALNASVAATFSELLDPSTVTSNSFTLAQQSNGAPVAGSVFYDGNSQTVTLVPSILASNTKYVATLKGGANGIKDLAGNSLATDQTWTFTTFAQQAPPSGTSDLSALTIVGATNGWGPVEINMSNGEQAAGDGHTMKIRGTTFLKGLGVHAPSDVHYYLGNACSALTATIGIDDEVAPNGSVVFQVLGDGTKLYDSGILTGASSAQTINVNLSGKNDLELVVNDAGDGNASDHADWAIPRITCGTQQTTTISNVQFSVTSSSTVVISWSTNNVADSQIDDGTTTAYGSSTPLDSSLTTSHSQQITGLAANTTYHFRVKSRDSGGTLVTSPDATFTTPPANSTSTFVSDLTPTSSTNGWGPIEKDKSNGEQAAGDGHTISIRGKTYAKGLGVHAVSDVKYNVGGTCTAFISDIGIDDEVQPNGTVVFQVWGDGTKLYDSGVVNGTMAAKSISVNIAGKNQLELVVADDGDGLGYDHADWAGARIQCGSAATPVVTISSPGSTLTYKVGDVINYSGSAKDSNGNAIPAGGLVWQVIIHHCPGGSCHTHPFLSTTGPTGSFTVPDHGDNSYFELDLTATDSNGVTGTAAVSINPQTVQLTLATTPSSLQVIYGGTPYTAPANITTIVNSVHTIQVTSPQGSNVFASWSDGGAIQHNITIGAANTTITAAFSSSAGFSVTAVTPPNGATGVATNTSVTATFSATINQSTLTSQTMNVVQSGSSNPIAAALTYDAAKSIATLTPSAALQKASYTATVKGGANGIKDLNGNALSADTVWTFSTLTSTSGMYLSDLTWTSATNGWGPVERDTSNGEQAAGDGHTISIRGTSYPKGLGTHAASDIVFPIPQGCTAFTGVVGVDDEVAPNGSVVFSVLVDGVKMFDSGIMTGAMPGSNVNVNIAGHTNLELVVGVGNGVAYDHADWANAQLTCGQIRPPAGTSYLSDLTATSMANGWGPVEKDTSNGENAAGDGHTISIRGTKYTKGLGAHAVSDVRYNLGGACTTFSAVVGIDDEAAPSGSVIFQVWTDGIKAYDSGVLTGIAAGKSVSVNLSGKSEVRLAIVDDGDGLGSDHGDWANAQIVCP